MKKTIYEETKELVNEAEELTKTHKEAVYDNIIAMGYNPDKVYALSKTMYNKVTKAGFATPPAENSDAEGSEETGNTDQFAAIKNTILDMIKTRLHTNEFEAIRNAILFPERKTLDYDRAEEEKNILEAFDKMLDYLDTEDTYKDVKSDVDAKQADFLAYLNSEEYYEKKQQGIKDRIDELATLEKVTGRDRNTRRIMELKKKIAVDKGQWDLSFIKDGKATVKNTVEVYFNPEKSTYTAKKYYAKCNQIHLNADVFRYFLNLEEKHLDEKYHPFNNLFLFRCMRYIGTLDVKDSEYQFRTIVGTLTKLVYDSFPNEETKAQTIHAIESYLDQFIDAGYTDLFIEKNITYPKHPERIKKDKEREQSARVYYYKVLASTPHDKTVEELDAMAINDLAEYAEKVVKEAAEKAKAEEEKANQELADKIAGTDTEDSDEEETEPADDTGEEAKPEENDGNDHTPSDSVPTEE